MGKDKKPKEIEKNEDMLKLETEVAELKNKLARALADYQNLQRQSIAQVENMRIMSLSSILGGLIEASDDLELALRVTENTIDPVGIKNISEKLKKIIIEVGCDIVSPVEGDDFNSTTMEAITQIDPKKEQPEFAGKVAEAISAGIVYEGKILRPAKVILYKSIL
jgi:molecular chaperone GrpE